MLTKSSKNKQFPNKGRLTDDYNVGIDRQEASPEDGAQGSPFGILGARSAGKELVQQPEDEQTDNLGHNPDSNCEALDDEVRNVKVGCSRQSTSQNGEN